MSFPIQPSFGVRAFSLVEVVLALSICAFVLITMLGLLGTGLQSSKDSEDQIQAANLASLMISTCLACPTNTPANFAIPTSALTNVYATSPVTNAIGLDGYQTNIANATYLVSYQAGTNAMSGSGLSQLYMMLTWPAQASTNNASTRRYEVFTYIPLK